MAISNKFGSLLLTTETRANLPLVICTLYGDMLLGTCCNFRCPKTLVFELAKHINSKTKSYRLIRQKNPICRVRPDQKDSDSLPDYEVLDDILHAYIEEGKAISSIVKLGYDEDIVRKIVRLVDINEHKRYQSAPGLKTTPLAFGMGRRIPIVQKYAN